MNEFLDNLGKAVNETAKKAIKASGDVVELTKTSLNIKFDEVKRESYFKEIGKIVYDAYKDSPESITDEILEFCKCIDEIDSEIAAQKVKAASIKNKKFCVNCDVLLCKTVNFCYSCGAKQPEIVEEDEETCGCGCCGEDEDEPEDCVCDDECDCAEEEPEAEPDASEEY